MIRSVALTPTADTSLEFEVDHTLQTHANNERMQMGNPNFFNPSKLRLNPYSTKPLNTSGYFFLFRVRRISSSVQVTQFESAAPLSSISSRSLGTLRPDALSFA